MSVKHGWKRLAAVIGVFVGVWLALRYLFPLFLPFLLGLALALAAEPPGKFLQEKLHWRKNPAIFAAVTGTLLVFPGVLVLLMGLLVRRASALAEPLADAAQQMSGGIATIRSWALSLCARAPESMAEPLTRSVGELFSSGGALLDLGTGAALDLAGKAAGQIPGSLVMLGTAVLSAYLICPRLDRLRRYLGSSRAWQDRWRPALVRLGCNARQWLKAQLKLSTVTFAIVLAGLTLLGIRPRLVMALVVALVDAVPLLGTGTVLLPWALVCILTAQPVRAVGLLGIYVTALLTRSALEPRWVGRQLGLDPLVSLIALYTGFRLWGFGGMILAPILTVTARELCRSNS